MAARIPDRHIEAVTPSGDNALRPSSERVKQLALQKRENYLNRKEEKPMKKAPIKILLAAALVVILSFSAFAAFGGLDYLRSIFGDSIDSIQDQVVTPLVKGSVDGRELAVEALVTDGYVTNLIVSLTGEEPAEPQPFVTESQGKIIEDSSTIVIVAERGDPSEGLLFNITGDFNMRSTGWTKLNEFSTAGKTTYAIDVLSEQRFDKANIQIALNKDIADITLDFEVENNLGNAAVNFPAGAKSGQTRLMEPQISPMGFLLTGSEENPQGGLPPTRIKLIFANNKSEDMNVEFAGGEGATVGGGGGAIMTGRWEKAPLVTKFHGVRNPDGELVITGQFSRVINPAEIVKVVIDGAEYPVN